MATPQDIPRSEPVRPQYYRSDWLCLNGAWDFWVDDRRPGTATRPPASKPQGIIVPFAPESALSGIGNTGFMESIWYRKMIQIPESWSGQSVLLHFGAVDWCARVWVNGQALGKHYGGTTHFFLDITSCLMAGEDVVIVVNAIDGLRSAQQPAGKQSLNEHPTGARYTRTTGIWQPVWLESTGKRFLSDVQILPDLYGGAVSFIPRFNRVTRGDHFRVRATIEGQDAGQSCVLAQNGIPTHVDVAPVCPWSPTTPTLYDLTFEMLDAAGNVLDRVQSYVGLRSVSIDGDQIYLNGEPIYLRSVLDQGYYSDGILTAPDDEALKHDVELAKTLGFNGARPHQKVFDPRFHYWADRLGYLTWGESPSWGFDVDDAAAWSNFLTEWPDIMRQTRNHPSLIAPMPLKETAYGDVRYGGELGQVHGGFVEETAKITRLLDPTRPVNDASGWVHRDTDIWTSHTYEQDPAKLIEALSPHPNVFRNAPHAEPDYGGQPYIVDEFGGAGFDVQAQGQAENVPATIGAETKKQGQVWGYREGPKSLAELGKRIASEVRAVLSVPHVSGYCYTQLTDVEQEKNGLLTAAREPKIPISDLNAIFSRDPQCCARN